MSGAIKIGWAQRDITPHRPIALRGQFNLRIATRVQDPLTVTALALDNGDDCAIIVSLDFVAVDVDTLAGVRAGLAARLPGLDPHKVIASGTHTHTGPFAGMTAGLQNERDYLEALRARYPDYMGTDEYTPFLVGQILDAICEAWEQRTAGLIGWGYAHAVIGENRRVRYFDDRAVMYGSTAAPDFSHIEGHVDHSVNLLFTYDPAQALTGVLVNIACPSQASESGQDFISADFWHDVREELRRRYGAGLFILPQCSAAGDQSPHRLIARAAEDRMLQLKYGGGVGRPLSTALRQDIARRIATAVDDAEPAVRNDLRAEVVLKHAHRDLSLPHWQVTDAEYTTVKQQIVEARQRLEELSDADRLGDEVTALRSRINWCQRVVNRYENPPASIPAELNVLRLSEIAFATAGFEYYLDYGDRIKGRSAAQQTFVVQLTAGGTYLATERAAAGLSYGAVPASCVISPAGGQVIVEAAVATIAALFAE